MYPCSRVHSNRRRRVRQSNSGQIVVEYILLLIVAVVLALVITNIMVSRGDNEGFVITKWKEIISTIGSDKTDGTD
jgi:uncharacterized protein (UPF0333 family)